MSIEGTPLQQAGRKIFKKTRTQKMQLPPKILVFARITFINYSQSQRISPTTVVLRLVVAQHVLARSRSPYLIQC